jgi:3-dehydroquinate dehydratase-2
LNIVILNGPNLNLLGKRETEIYGQETFEEYLGRLRAEFPELDLHYFQSNVEGELINAIHDYGFRAAGIIINPGGYGHTSIAVADAMKAVPARVVEVHISNVFSREGFRRTMITAGSADGLIIGLGLEVYRLAILSFTGPGR